MAFLPILLLVGELMFQILLVISLLSIQIIISGCSAIQQKMNFGVSKSLSVKLNHEVYSGESIFIDVEGCVGDACQFELVNKESGYVILNDQTSVTYYSNKDFQGSVELYVTDGVQQKKSIKVEVRKKPFTNKSFIKMALGNTYFLDLKNGFGNFKYEIFKDLTLTSIKQGTVVLSNGKFPIIGDNIGSYKIKITDGKEEKPEVMVVNLLVNEKLNLSPDEQILQVKGTLIVNPTGGTETYSFSKTGSGTISFTGGVWVYLAPESGTGSTVIKVEDDFDNNDGVPSTNSKNSATISVSYQPESEFDLVVNTDRYTNKSKIPLKVTNCSGFDVLLNESATDEADTWSSCPASPGTINYSFVNSGTGIVNGEHKIYLRFKNKITKAVEIRGNLSVFYDNTAPILSSLTIDKTLYRGGEKANISWNQTETYKQSLQLYYGSDNTWESIANLTEDPSQYEWTIPKVNFVNKKIKLKATDKAGNNSERLIDHVFEVDSTSPAIPIVTLISDHINNKSLIYKLVDCQGLNNNLKISINEFSSTSIFHTEVKSCVVSSSEGTTLTLPDSILNRLYEFKVSLIDPAGNESEVKSIPFSYDTVAPHISDFSLPPGLYSGNAKFDFSWKVSDGVKLMNKWELSYTIDGGQNFKKLINGLGDLTSEAGVRLVKNIEMKDVTSDNLIFKIIEYDKAGNFKIFLTPNDAYKFDAQKPLITAFAPQSGAAAVNKIAVDWKISASKSSPAKAKITHYMMSYAEADDSLIPSTDDFRWTYIEADKQSLSINLSNLRFQLGPVPRVYKVKAWVKDELGNVSDARPFLITLNPMLPAEISNFIIANKNISGLSEFNSETDILFTSNADMFVYWRITDDDVLGANSLSIDYTLDNGATWHALVNNLNPNARTGCALVVDTTGCVKIQSPTMNSFLMRMKITDSDGQVTMANSMILNGGRLSSIAGNVTEGLGGIHSNAVFFNLGNAATPNTFVMTSNGDLIMIEQALRRIVLVSHLRGNKEILMDYKESALPSVADGEALVTASKVRAPSRIAIDKNDNVFIADFDRIRLMNVKNPDNSQWKIKTIIGGSVATGANLLKKGMNQSPDSIQLTTGNTIFGFSNGQSFAVTQNGVLYFGLNRTFKSDGVTLLHNNLIGKYQVNTNMLDLFEIKQDYPKIIDTTNLKATLSFSLENPLVLTRFALEYPVNQEDQFKMYLSGMRSKADFGRELPSEELVPDYLTKNCQLCFFYRSSFDSAGQQMKIDQLGSKSYQFNHQPWETASGFYTGLDGKMYVITGTGKSLVRVTESNTVNSAGEKEFNLTLVYGKLSGSATIYNNLYSLRNESLLGTCTDGTLANNCAANLSAVFVNTQGKIYVIDNQQVKTIDDDGKVLTLYGQSPFSGEGGLASDARFTTIRNLSVWQNPESLSIIVNDSESYRLREFQPNNKIYTVAGGDYVANPTVGELAAGLPIVNQGQNSGMNAFFFSVLGNGNVIKGLSSNTHSLLMVNRTTGKWERMFQTQSGASSFYYNMPDKKQNAVDIASINWGSYFPTTPIGATGSKILLIDGEHKFTTLTSAFQPAVISEYDTITQKIHRIAGSWDGVFVNDTGPMFCTENTSATSCQLHGGGIVNRFKYHPSLGWVGAFGNQIKSLYSANDNETAVVKPILTLPFSEPATKPISFDFKQRSGLESHIYDFWYCRSGSIKQVIWNSTDNTQTNVNLEWNVAGMTCESNDLQFVEYNGRKMLIFPYKMNGQYGVGRYLLN